MNVAERVVERIEGAGGVLVVNGEHIRVRLPEDSTYLIEELREHKQEVLFLLRTREVIPSMPHGLHLVSWGPKPAPVLLTRYSIVTNVSKFISMTLLELDAALDDKPWISGHWSVGELVERLEQCGVIVKIDEAQRAGR